MFGTTHTTQHHITLFCTHRQFTKAKAECGQGKIWDTLRVQTRTVNMEHVAGDKRWFSGDPHGSVGRLATERLSAHHSARSEPQLRKRVGLGRPLLLHDPRLAAQPLLPPEPLQARRRAAPGALADQGEGFVVSGFVFAPQDHRLIWIRCRRRDVVSMTRFRNA